MLQPGAENATAGEGAGAANGAHREGGAHETSSDMAAVGEEASKSRGGSGGNESAGGGGCGSRWPRQETLALLQIRSDMDAVFRDSSHKGPLWDEISRKMAKMGYHRSAKKCREKFENVYKYHKRTKGGRASKSDGKTYRFFEQLEALEAANNSSSSFHSPIDAGAVPIAMAMPPHRPAPPPPETTAVYTTPTQPKLINPTVPSTTPPPVLLPPVMTTAQVIHMPPAPTVRNVNPMNFPSSTSGTPSSSSSTSSDEEVMKGITRSKRKRKWKGLFEKLTRDVMEKQEELQRKFLEAIEKRENDRRVREEAWKAQEIARLKREHEILVQDRSAAAAKDATLVAFLQKLSDQKQIPLPTSLIIQSQAPPPPATYPVPISQAPSTYPEANASTPVTIPTAKHQSNGSDPVSGGGGGSSRWPKVEIDALIKLRTSMDHKYQENTPKGALWEEISGEMKKLGYNRNAKRCKEKWENINKYFKKVKEHNKRRREDSKTCPYYSQLEALYREKKPKQLPPPPPIMAQPEQQWPLPPQPQEQDPVSDHMDQDDEEYDEDDEDLDGGYEIVANSTNASSKGSATAAMETS